MFVTLGRRRAPTLVRKARDPLLEAVAAFLRSASVDPVEARALLAAGAAADVPALVTFGSTDGLVDALAGAVSPVAKARLEESFVMRPVEALAWARLRGAELVVEISESMRSTIREVIVDGIERGLGTDAIAARLPRSMGLFTRWARAVDNFHARLIASGTPSGRAAQQTERYRNRLLDRRADMIARTEAIRATSEATQFRWRSMAIAGVFDAEPVREWVTAPLDRPSKQGKVVCPICRPLNGVRVSGLNSVFASGTFSAVAPPLHPSCRCRLVLVEASPTPFAELPPAMRSVVRKHGDKGDVGYRAKHPNLKPSRLPGGSVSSPSSSPGRKPSPGPDSPVPGLTPVELDRYRAQLPAVKTEVRAQAKAASEESRRFLDLSEAGGKLSKAPKRRTVVDGRGRRLVNDAGEWDWFFALEERERDRIDRYFMAPGGIKPDILADNWQQNFGGTGDVDDVMGEWLFHTRRQAAGNALAGGRRPNPKLYGGLTAQELVDSPYDIDLLWGDEDDALAHLAEVEQGALADYAARSLIPPGKPSGLTPPWEMSESDYVAEVETVAAAFYLIDDPTASNDEFASALSPADVATARRFNELVPPDIEGSDDPESWEWMHQSILQLAQTAGLSGSTAEGPRRIKPVPGQEDMFADPPPAPPPPPKPDPPPKPKVVTPPKVTPPPAPPQLSAREVELESLRADLAKIKAKPKETDVTAFGQRVVDYAVSGPEGSQALAQQRADIDNQLTAMTAKYKADRRAALAAGGVDALGKVDGPFVAARQALAARRDSLRPQAVRDALAELRPMGQPLDAKGAPRKVHLAGATAPEVRSMLEDVSQWLPTDWLDKHQKPGGGKPMEGIVTTGRAHYKPAAPAGDGTYRPVLEVRAGATSTALHEFTHRMEHVVPGISALEFAFWRRRTNDGEGRRRYRGGDDGEWVSPDELADEYIGRSYIPGSAPDKARLDALAKRAHKVDYEGEQTRYWEVASMGMEGLVFDKAQVWDKDPDHINFMVGLLATAGRKPVRIQRPSANAGKVGDGSSAI